VRSRLCFQACPNCGARCMRAHLPLSLPITSMIYAMRWTLSVLKCLLICFTLTKLATPQLGNAWNPSQRMQFLPPSVRTTDPAEAGIGKKEVICGFVGGTVCDRGISYEFARKPGRPTFHLSTDAIL